MHNHKKHWLLMLACCLIPLAGLVAVWVFRVPLNSVVFIGMVALCPLLHVAMMWGMLRHDKPGQAGGPTAGPVHAGCHAPAVDTPAQRELAGEGS